MKCFCRCYVVGKSQLPGVSLSIAGSRNSSKCSSELASVVLTVSRVKQNHVPKQPSDCSLSTKLPGSVEQAITEWEDTAWAQFPSVSEQLISDKRSSKTASKHFESVACAHYGILTGMLTTVLFECFMKPKHVLEVEDNMSKAWFTILMLGSA